MFWGLAKLTDGHFFTDSYETNFLHGKLAVRRLSSSHPLYADLSLWLGRTPVALNELTNSIPRVFASWAAFILESSLLLTEYFPFNTSNQHRTRCARSSDEIQRNQFSHFASCADTNVPNPHLTHANHISSFADKIEDSKCQRRSLLMFSRTPNQQSTP